MRKKDMESEKIKSTVREKYGKIAAESSANYSCCCGPACCSSTETYNVFSENYDNREGYIPEADFGLGCGIPTDYAGIKKGDHVLDLGSGAGNDCFVARAIVGETGKVTGLDMTEQMIEKAKENCKKHGFDNVSFVQGDIEQMPFDENTFDVIVSNCVLNLVPDKKKAFDEIYRVLKPGGRFCISDIVIKGDLPESLRQDAEMYAGCVSGAINISEYLSIIERSGFSSAIIHKQREISLPEDLPGKYLSEQEKKDFIKNQTGIFSITISASKP